MKKNKLIVILGPTACGKTKLASALAFKYNGEIVSADSRQVYRGMDIGTGKDLGDYVIKSRKANGRPFKTQIPHFLIDVISPKKAFNVSEYQKLVYSAIDDILSREKTPFLVGGTGLYIDAVIKGYQFNRIRNNESGIRDIRKKLDKLSLDQLLIRLKKIDPATYKIIDQKNRRRVQRALEIYEETGRLKSERLPNQKPPYDILILGIKFPLDEIYGRIDSRLESRIKEGMIKEVEKLRKQGVSWKGLDSFGLEYRWVANYLRKKISYEELVAGLKNNIHQFAKRQLTWFGGNDDIVWIKDKKTAEKEIKKFLSK